MSDPSKQADQEPSIEEILSSIRQIISDDEDEDDVKSDPVEDVSEAEDEEPIVLTQRVDPDPDADFDDFMDKDDAPEEEVESEPEPEIDMQDVEPEEMVEEEDDIDVGFEASDPVIEPDPVPVKEKPAPRNKVESRVEESLSYNEDSDEEESLLTKRAEDAAYGAFKKLAVKTAVDSISGITIEEIVRDELRPMLRVWLDENLPSIVERLVKEELDRVARRALEE